MNSHRLRLKIGEHEFEADGAPEFVEQQLRAFMQLIRPAPPPSPPIPPSMEHLIARVARVHRTTVSLTVKAPSLMEAALLIVVANRMLRSKDAVSGGDVKRGLASSGVKVPRVDRLLASIAKAGDLVVSGRKRAKRYRLTDAGLVRSRAIATAIDTASA